MDVFVNVLVANPWILFLFILWDLTWKGLALWRSARNGAKVWFVAILVVNSVGLLPIIYLVINRKKSDLM